LPATTDDLDVLRRGSWFSTLPTPLQERIAAVAVMRNYRKSQHLSGRTIRHEAFSESSAGAHATCVR
jgi:hypothetical protein